MNSLGFLSYYNLTWSFPSLPCLQLTTPPIPHCALIPKKAALSLYLIFRAELTAVHLKYLAGGLFFLLSLGFCDVSNLYLLLFSTFVKMCVCTFERQSGLLLWVAAMRLVNNKIKDVEWRMIGVCVWVSCWKLILEKRNIRAMEKKSKVCTADGTFSSPQGAIWV